MLNFLQYTIRLLSCRSWCSLHGFCGGQDEYSLVEALKAGSISKPVVAWVSGTCATLFKSEVQFGHAGAKSGGALESAQVCGARCGHERYGIMLTASISFAQTCPFESKLRFRTGVHV